MAQTPTDYEQFINRRVKEILGDEWHMLNSQEKIAACIQAEREWRDARTKGVNEFLEKVEVTP